MVKNIIAFVLAAMMSVVIVFVAALLFFPDDNKDDALTRDKAPVSLTVSQSECRAALYNFSFSLGGEDYSLPCQYSLFERNGWLLKNPTEKISAGTNMTGIYLKKAKTTLNTEIINYSRSPIMCCKGQIHCISANVSDFDWIDISGAITCDRNTTPKLVRFTLGDPDALEEDDNKITLTYTKAKHEEVKFIFYKKRFGSAKKSVTTGSPFESGYYEHAVVFECRKAP